jgi:hypothetical protein
MMTYYLHNTKCNYRNNRSCNEKCFDKFMYAFSFCAFCLYIKYKLFSNRLYEWWQRSAGFLTDTSESDRMISLQSIADNDTTAISILG